MKKLSASQASRGRPSRPAGPASGSRKPWKSFISLCFQPFGPEWLQGEGEKESLSEKLPIAKGVYIKKLPALTGYGPQIEESI